VACRTHSQEAPASGEPSLSQLGGSLPELYYAFMSAASFGLITLVYRGPSY